MHSYQAHTMTARCAAYGTEHSLAIAIAEIRRAPYSVIPHPLAKMPVGNTVYFPIEPNVSKCMSLASNPRIAKYLIPAQRDDNPSGDVAWLIGGCQ